VDKDSVQNAAFLKKSYNYEKSDGERFSAFLFFCVQERRTRDDPKISPKSCCGKKTKQKAEKRATTNSPKKHKKKWGKAKKMSGRWARTPDWTKRVKIHVFLNFAIHDAMAQLISPVKLKEGTCAVILHSVSAPGDTCSTCGVRLKFASRQLGFQGFESQPVAL
jgi:hypothetical protein